MSSHKQKDVESDLLKKGFVLEEKHHRYFTYHRAADSKKTSIFTKTSHGARDIDDSLLGLMAKQCKLSRSDFVDLVQCPLSRENYEVKLAAQGIPVAEPVKISSGR